MTNPFFDRPILNSPYDYPARHWELDDQGQPTQRTIESRRCAEFITPIPQLRSAGGRRPDSRTFTRGFLIVAPGLTIRDRLRVLQPHDPDSDYASHELLPTDMLGNLERAKIVITNYHTFRRRERLELSRGSRALLQGRGQPLSTLETEGQMLQRVMPELMGLKHILVINDEAHHCYREKPEKADDGNLKGEDRQEAEKNNEAARVWISGPEVVARKLGVSRVIDLSATPFFLCGSGYPEGWLSPGR